MQHYDAYMDPVTHQMQQTIYLARRNAKPVDDTDMFEIISWTEPKAAADTDANGKCKLIPYDQVPSVDS
jgi:branched-chain amino acid transport system substrate-binding protein